MNWNDEQYQRERYADMIRALERERMLDAVLAGLPRRPPRYHAVFVSIGGVLVNIGSRLQRRYGTITEVTISVRARDNLPLC